ncbi:MAG TPA: NAD(P)-dependent oxidoreductase, partial [Solirubrobacteraceae bacterium]
AFDARPIAGAGFERAGSLADLAGRSDVVITMLPDGEAVRRVAVGEGDRLLGAMPAGAVLIDMGSSSPTGTQALGRTFGAAGIAMLDAPVSGGVVRARAGTLSIMVGGERATIDRCRPVFARLGAQVFETGPLGSAHAMKALNNLVSAAGFLAAAEALLVGRRFGLDPGVMLDVFNASTARNNSTENKFRPFVLSRSFASGFSLGLMVKDLGTAVALAEATATPAPFAARCRELWATAETALEPGADHTALVRWLETLAGTTLDG